MSKVEDDGGAAFPSLETIDKHGEPGMTLRDYFAAQAIGAIGAFDITPEGQAKYAFRIADAMLAERRK